MKSIYIRGREFRAIPGCAGYFVSNYGSIASTVGKVGALDKPRRDLRKPYIKKLQFEGGYYRFTQHVTGNRKYMLVHHAVLLAWVGPRPAGARGRHLDGLTRRNRADNLAWGTHQENMADMTRHLSRAGHRNHRAKMNLHFVLKLREMAHRKYKRSQPWLPHLMRRFPQYSQFALWAAATGYTWSHLTNALPTKRKCSKHKSRKQ